ncbi:unnamed protein product [Adineta ricciae]|nr:unnamed protein product [Adineta ricciae]
MGLEFGLTDSQFLMLLREKQRSNQAFYLDYKIKKYARMHKTTRIYDLNDFLKKQSMYELDQQNLLLLQLIFWKVCRIINKQNNPGQQIRWEPIGSAHPTRSDRIPGDGIALDSDWKNPAICCKFYERYF